MRIVAVEFRAAVDPLGDLAAFPHAERFAAFRHASVAGRGQPGHEQAVLRLANR